MPLKKQLNIIKNRASRYWHKHFGFNYTDTDISKSYKLKV